MAFFSGTGSATHFSGSCSSLPSTCFSSRARRAAIAALASIAADISPDGAGRKTLSATPTRTIRVGPAGPLPAPVVHPSGVGGRARPRVVACASTSTRTSRAFSSARVTLTGPLTLMVALSSPSLSPIGGGVVERPPRYGPPIPWPLRVGLHPRRPVSPFITPRGPCAPRIIRWTVAR